MTTNVKEKVATARPVVERVAKDQKFQKHVKSAYGSARTIYDELFSEAGLENVTAPGPDTTDQATLKPVPEPVLAAPLKTAAAGKVID